MVGTATSGEQCGGEGGGGGEAGSLAKGDQYLPCFGGGMFVAATVGFWFVAVIRSAGRYFDLLTWR